MLKFYISRSAFCEDVAAELHVQYYTYRYMYYTTPVIPLDLDGADAQLRDRKYCDWLYLSHISLF